MNRMTQCPTCSCFQKQEENASRCNAVNLFTFCRMVFYKASSIVMNVLKNFRLDKFINWRMESTSMMTWSLFMIVGYTSSSTSDLESVDEFASALS